ncbi:MAG: DNA (cytosine-5-)-methyltransferase [Clostridium sp.]|jgi:DNA (cytosine-5)-methyltransferase 1|nr:DNA (cytosine-5-)-methyltransferase [Clostridium sp.]
MISPKEIKFIDLFCGIGGIRLGMQSAGLKCVFSCDINSECQRTYNANFGEVPQGDIRDISEDDVPDFDVLCAGFPCQPFSISGKQKGFDDDRGTLFFEICRFIEKSQPRVVFLENVKHLIHHDKGNTLETILNKLRAMGYTTEWRLLNAADYGVPQNRERIIIIASKSKVFDFAKLKQTPRRNLLGYLDKSGVFEYLEETEYTLIDNPTVQKKSGLYFVGYRNKSIRKVGVRPGTEHLSRVHKQPNRIYSVMGIHPTLPSQEMSGRFWILTPDNRVRKLTIDECFRIMGFPDDFERPSIVGEQYKQIGNSVCVPMIAAVAEALKEQYFSEGVGQE